MLLDIPNNPHIHRCRLILSTEADISENWKKKKRKAKNLTLTDKELETLLSFLGLGQYLSWIGEHYELTADAMGVAFGRADVAAIKRIEKKAEELL